MICEETGDFAAYGYVLAGSLKLFGKTLYYMAQLAAFRAWRGFSNHVLQSLFSAWVIAGIGWGGIGTFLGAYLWAAL